MLAADTKNMRSPARLLLLSIYTHIYKTDSTSKPNFDLIFDHGMLYRAPVTLISLISHILFCREHRA